MSALTDARSRPREGVSYRRVALGFAMLLALGIGIALVIYFRLIRYERIAARHVPPDATLVARVDVEQVILYEPFRKNLLPLVNLTFGQRRTATLLAPRIKRIQAKTGIELGIDVRELAVARGPSSSDWVIVLAGKFPKSGVVEGIFAVLSEEGMSVEVREGEPRTLSLPGGLAFGQARDGALVLASNAPRLSQALARNEPVALGLNLEAPLAFAFQGQLFYPGIEHVSGTARLAAMIEIEARARLSPAADAASVERGLKELLAALDQQKTLLPPWDTGLSPERRGLSTARVTALGAREVKIEASCERSGIDRGAAALGAFIRPRLLKY